MFGGDARKLERCLEVLEFDSETFGCRQNDFGKRHAPGTERFEIDVRNRQTRVREHPIGKVAGNAVSPLNRQHANGNDQQ